MKLLMSSSPTNPEWFKRLITRLHKRVGDNVKPDLAVSIDVMLEMMSQFERKWKARDWTWKANER
jgi:hypothetical protein